MSEFMDIVESITQEEVASAQTSADFFKSDGDGFTRGLGVARARGGLLRKQKVIECARFLERARNGYVSRNRMQEAMSTSDFTSLYGDIIDRQMLGMYTTTRPVWRQFMRAGTLRDFRQAKLIVLDGGKGQLEEVKQGEDYKEVALSDSHYLRQVKKYGKIIRLTFEMIVNDDLGAFNSIPRILTDSAVLTESKLSTSLYVGTTGPIAGVYSVGNRNIINATNSGDPYTAVNPPLSIEAIQQGLLVLANMKDSDNNPIVITAVTLVVPPSLEVIANNIVNAVQLIIGADSASQRLVTNNWLSNRLTVVVDPFIPIVASSSNGNTSWFLMASPSSPRPAFEFDFLAGYETPQLFMKSPNALTASGGQASVWAGDFDNDDIAYKVRAIMGGAAIDPKMTVASNGSGS